jgi:dihydrofolate reductase
MKTILYMAVTANGYIAKENDDTSWITTQEWNSYSAMVRKAGNLIIGHRTYDILTKQPEFAEFSEVKIVVVSSNDFQTLSPNHSIVKTPQEALDVLKDFTEVIVAGGGNLNASFMKEKLVDEIYLDIEPIALGKGIKLFADGDFEAKLQLIESKNISKNEIQLHYQVLK